MDLSKDEVVHESSRFLERLLRELHLDVEFACEPEGQLVSVSFHGPDTDLLLSNNARLLYAINHLLNRVFYRKSSERVNFLLDCNQYRAARVVELQLLARKAAEEVKRSRAPYALQPMPSSERRVIHLTLSQESGIQTQSEGSGLHRHVIVRPG